MSPAGSSRLLPLIFLLCAAAPSHAAGETPSPSEKVAWLASHASALRTLDPKDRDYTDLRPLQQAIGAARVVLLGGANEGAQLKVRYRLVRFLHEEMGFDVLTSDVSLFDGEEFDRTLDRGKAPRPDLQELLEGGFSYFPKSGGSWERIDILSYIRDTHKTSRPLHFSGYGTWISPYMVTDYSKALAQMLDSVAPKLADTAERKAIVSLVQMIGPIRLASGGMRTRRFDIPAKEWGKIFPPGLKAIAKLYVGLGHLAADREDAGEIVYFRQTLSNLAYQASLAARRGPSQLPPDSAVAMAQTWRKDSKIIVWSDNWTAARNWPGQKRGHTQLDAQSAGTEMVKAFGNDVYSIACSEIKNSNGVLQLLQAGDQPALIPVDGDLESLLHSAGKPLSFVDFRSVPAGHWLRTALTTRLVHGVDTDIWPDRYDGLLTIDIPAAKDHK